LVRKQARRKKILTVLAVAAAVLIVAAIVTIGTIADARTDIFGDGDQVVRLRPNGRFTATLYHGFRHSGSYTLSEEGGVTTVLLTTGGTTIEASIIDGRFFLPDAWQDNCGHNMILSRR